MTVRYRVPGQCFYSVTECVTEIQLLPLAFVTKIAGNYVALVLDAFRYDIVYVVAKACRIFEEREQRSVAENAVFYDFRHSVRDKILGKGGEKRGVAKHKGRLVECTDKIFSLGNVDSGFSSDGRVHHCQNRRGYGDIFYAPQIHRRRKSCHVSRDASAESCNAVAPCKPFIGSVTEYFAEI